MATRLRKFSRSKGLKGIIYSLTIVFMTAIVLQSVYVYYRNYSLEPLFVSDYTKSKEFIDNELTQVYREMYYYLARGENPDEPHYYYYFTDGVKYFNNISLSDLQNHKFKYEFEIQPWIYNDFKATEDDDKEYTLYVAFPEEYINQKTEEWDNVKNELVPIAVSLALSFIAAIICLIYLLAVAGRRPEDDEIHLTGYSDRIYSDIQIGATLLTLYMWSGVMRSYLVDRNHYSTDYVMNMDQKVSMIVIGLTTGVSAIICLELLLSLTRKLKARKLLKHSTIYAIFSGISKFVRSFFDDSRFEHYPLTKSLNRRQIIFTVSSGVMVLFFFVFLLNSLLLCIIPVILEALIIFWYFYENNKTFDEINLGFQESYKEMMKSERMKVDLITNVSHDLKTPLTSIISYVELLSKEDLPETARDYVNILAEKSERLKNIVSDLFDLAKSTSGNLPLNLENLDLKKLIEQTLADMEDDIEKSKMRIKTTFSENPVYIYSDGKKLYRVFQNIIGNALKYSLAGTRIFIDMETANNYVNVTVKNTASYDMDFTAEEILQRFSRGDKARTTEGSGLGLSIAESFTRACGGSFKVEIDGDQFKVRLGFPVSGIIPPDPMADKEPAI